MGFGGGTDSGSASTLRRPRERGSRPRCERGCTTATAKPGWCGRESAENIIPRNPSARERGRRYARWAGGEEVGGSLAPPCLARAAQRAHRETDAYDPRVHRVTAVACWCACPALCIGRLAGAPPSWNSLPFICSPKPLLLLSRSIPDMGSVCSPLPAHPRPACGWRTAP